MTSAVAGGVVERLLVTLTVAELDSRIERAVAKALAQAAPALGRAADKRARLTTQETAAELRCSVRQVQRLMRSGKLTPIKLGRGTSARTLIARADVERFCQEGGV